MRAALAIAGLILAATTQALAQPPALVLPEPFAAGHGAGRSDANSFQDITSNGTARAWSWRSESAASSDTPISFGPLSMDVGHADIIGRDGKQAHYAHVQLDTVHVLGGNISGNFDGRAATLHLSWHTGE
jgi:hypothetical protein